VATPNSTDPALAAALHAVLPARREALLLREIRGLSYHEIADEMKVSHPGVEATLSRARGDVGEELPEPAGHGGGRAPRHVRSTAPLPVSTPPSPSEQATDVAQAERASGGDGDTRRATDTPPPESGHSPPATTVAADTPVTGRQEPAAAPAAATAVVPARPAPVDTRRAPAAAHAKEGRH
jgi:hypothetical protein